ncbi:TRAP transporter large permease [Thermodesulfobacteriota bacterium]
MVPSLIGIAILLALAFSGVPLGFSMIAVGFVGFGMVRSWEASLEMTGQIILDLSMNYGFSTLPLFVLMGTFVYRSGLSEDLYETANAWLGHFRGGLAMATIAACGGFSAVSGSSAATAATMAKVALPPMRRFGYADTLATGSIAAGGTMGILIPPSVGLIVYGLLANEDIGALFMAGIIPGLITISLYIIAIDVITRINRKVGPEGPRSPWSKRWRSLYKVWGVLALFLFILGGIYAGVFTPTEAGAMGATGAFVFALARRRLKWLDFLAALIEAGRTTAMIFTVGFGALILFNFVNISGMPGEIVDGIKDLDLAPMGAILAIIGIYLIMGCVFDGMAIILLTTPIFAPVVSLLGFDLIWFGIVMIVAGEIAMITPPVGLNVFVLKTVVPDVPLNVIYRGILPFLAADIVRLALILFVPSISLLLPRLMG